MPGTRAPVSLHLIVRDEKELRAHLAPIREYVEEIVVVDTGSNPENLNALQDMWADGVIDLLELHDSTEFEFRGTGVIDFSRARNHALALCTQPWILWMDGDDEIAGIENLPRLIEDYSRLAAANPTYAIQLMFPYEYDYDPYGNCFVRFMRERLHNRMEEHAQDGHKSVWQWCDPIHETIFAVPRGGTVPVMRIENVAMTWKHRRAGSGKDGDASLTRNLKVLEAWAIHYAELQEKNSAIPNHYRLEFYYALTLHQLNVRLDEAVSHYKRAMDVAQSDDDVAMTAMKMSQLLVQLGRHREAIAYANMMIHVHETWGEGYFLAAKAYYYKAQAAGGSQHDWERCIHFGVLGLQMPPTQTIHIVDPQERANIYSYMIRAYDMLSRYDKALECAEKALQVYPADAGLRFNQRLFQGVIWGNEITNRMTDIARIIGEAGPGETNLFNVIRSLIERMKGHPLLGAILPNEIPGSNGPVFPKPPALRDDGKLRILIACGHSAEVWNPDILRGSGFGGGSETAVVEMSTRLAALGHFVKVITNCGEAKEYNGVHWENPDYLNRTDLAVDVCIVWRMANLLDSPVAMHARIRVLWLHDTVAHFATKENLAKVDYVFTLSKWHRDHIAAEYAGIGLRDEQVIQTRTAVPNIERFDNEIYCHGKSITRVDRDPYKFIWTSSLDRGLDIMLKMWPNIVGRYPQATLHIFYGFESWEKYHPDDTRIPALKAMIANLAEWGVTLRARVTPAQLAEEYLSAGVWAYPNRVFPEIACVSLYEAQVAGCQVICSNLAALAEGALHSALVRFDDPMFEKVFFDRVIEAIETRDLRLDGDRRESHLAIARRIFSYDGLVESWVDMFRQYIAEKAMKEIGKFEGVL